MSFLLRLLLQFVTVMIIGSQESEEKPDFGSTYSLFLYSYEPVTCSPTSSTENITEYIDSQNFSINSPSYKLRQNWKHLLSEKLQSCGYWINGKFTKVNDTKSTVKQSQPTCYRKETLNKMDKALIKPNGSCEDDFPRGLSFSTPLDLYNQKPSTVPQQFYDMSSIPLGKVLVFIGNSLSRQLFQRLIFFIRKIPFVIEHYTHRSMWYAFDHEKDFLLIESDEQHQNPINKTKYERIRQDVENLGFVEGKYTLFIMSFQHNNLNCLDTLENVKLFTDGLICQSHLTKNQQNIPLPMNWIFFKLNNQTLKSETMVLPGIKYFIFRYQTFDKRRISTNENHNFEKPERNSNCIDEVESKFTKLQCKLNVLTTADVHFMCSFQLRYPGEIGFIKFPANGDCTNTVNLNIVQRFLAFLFDKRL